MKKYGTKIPEKVLTRKQEILKKPKCLDQNVYADYITRDGLHEDLTLRVSIHFMNTSDGTQNYTGAKAKQWPTALINGANKRLRG